MNGLALSLVLGSAVIHASWNLVAKRAAGRHAGSAVVFVWLFASLSVLAYTPVVVAFIAWARPAFNLTHAVLALGSALLHVAYFVTLQRGYRVGDLSVVYPLARGSGPVLATVLAVLVLAERPGLQALAGTALVVSGVLVLAGGRRPPPSPGGSEPRVLPAGAVYGLVTGMFIGSYTVWDGYAVSVAGAAPLLFSYASEIGRAVMLTPVALARPGDVRSTWRVLRRPAMLIALLSPLAYLMVLMAMQFTPVSLVAPARETSILIGTLMGTRILAEGHGRRRAVGAVAMVLGVVLLATT